MSLSLVVIRLVTVRLVIVPTFKRLRHPARTAIVSKSKVTANKQTPLGSTRTLEAFNITHGWHLPLSKPLSISIDLDVRKILELHP